MYKPRIKLTKHCDFCGTDYVANYKTSQCCYNADCRAKYLGAMRKRHAKERYAKMKGEAKKVSEERPFTTLTVLMLIEREKQGWHMRVLADMLDRKVADLEAFEAEVRENGLMDRMKARIDHKTEVSDELVRSRRSGDGLTAHEWR